MSPYYEKIKSILVGLKVAEDTIRPEADLINDLGLSSVDVVDLIFSIEAAYDLKIPEEEIHNLLTIKDLEAYIKNNVSLYHREH
ncbi:MULTISPECIES: acyl carrier protein [Persicobacter]|uniref:Carrier domain-containing protein n=1 Tax=Persicobacter diffluens TaxID=981 RepID=A0AAN5AJI2_9BACT|nr:acyl carrier protein [Persicobacter sp. CCB-QB2]GJM59486.1 hypothetical protein PEDI_00380 [Persicobacter diffluens]